MSSSGKDLKTKRKVAGPDYVLPKRRSANAIFVPLWTMVAIMGADWEQPDGKKVAVAILAIGAAWAAVTFASQHLRLAGRKTTLAKALGITLIVTLGCCWASENWPDNAPLSVTIKIIAFGGMAALAVLSIAISILGLRVIKLGSDASP